MDTKTQLICIYKERIAQYAELAGKWNRRECEHWELAEARSAMEILDAILTGMDKRRK